MVFWWAWGAGVVGRGWLKGRVEEDFDFWCPVKGWYARLQVPSYNTAAETHTGSGQQSHHVCRGTLRCWKPWMLQASNPKTLNDDMIWYDMIWYDMIWYDVSTWTSPNVGRLGFSVIRLLSGWLSVGILYNACDYVSFWEGNCVGKRLGDPWIFRFSEMRNLDQHLSYIHGSCFLSNIQSILVVVSQRMLR